MLEGGALKIHDDPEVDILYIQIRNAKVASRRGAAGSGVDYAEDREIAGIELHIMLLR
ncbi:MAG: hypothetical protein CL923_10110 [Deltaproteobacteria bacterium]|nr:hypothetical protein [Deltaproteobacteria bacterium]